MFENKSTSKSPQKVKEFSERCVAVIFTLICFSHCSISFPKSARCTVYVNILIHIDQYIHTLCTYVCVHGMMELPQIPQNSGCFPKLT